jgi:hypothetical protein
MAEKLYKLFGWLLVSNRPAHILCVGLMSIVLGWQGGVGAIIALEYKDVQRGGWKCWDWLDVLAGAIGCTIGGWLNKEVV